MHTESDPNEATTQALDDSSKAPLPRFWIASVCALTFLAYASTLRFQFVHDDRGLIVENPAIRSWHAVPSYFASYVSHAWSGVAPTFLGNDYRPLFMLWLRINEAIFGNHPAGWHLTTLLAHVAATYCVILLARRILGDGRVALFSGLIFGLHPVHFEDVALVTNVSEPATAALATCAYLCWVRSREAGGRGRRWLALSLTLYALAMLTKETALVLPLILLASLWLGFPAPLDPRPRGWMQKSLRALRAVLPFFVSTAAYLGVRTVALQGFSHPAARVSWMTVILTWPSLLLFYLKLLVWPVGLSPFYGLQFVSHPTLLNPIIPALVLLLIAAGLWKWASHARPIALAIVWLLLPVLPVLNIQVFGDRNFAHNRYLYLPSVGFAFLVALALRRFRSGNRSFHGVPMGQGLVCFGLAIVLGVAINLEDRYYASDASFYSYAYAHMNSPDPAITMDYANILAQQGDVDQAAGLYHQLIQVHPGMWVAYFNLGILCYHQNRLSEAAEYLSRAAAGDPSQAPVFFYLGLTDMKLNRLNDADASLRRAVTLAPVTPNYHFALGMVLKLEGNRREALAEFTKELELNPEHKAAAGQAAELQHTAPGN